MTRILLIDDDLSLHELLGKYLEQQEYVVLHAYDGRAGLKLLFDERPDVMVLDIMMPKLDGWDTLKRIREMSNLPVILLTAHDTEQDKLRGFGLGSDDYITKPFSFAELAARIEAILKRVSGKSQASNVLKVGNLMLDPIHHRVTYDDEPMKLTPTEFKLLKILMQEPGRVFTQEQLVIRVWGEEYAEEIGYIRRYIWHLRRKIEPNPDEPQYILNEHGVGYKLVHISS
jgi:two-component system, OmpR family, KDP operon response regulator KdpE